MSISRIRLPTLALTLALPIACLSACGDFDRYDDRAFDFPAKAEPPVPHPIPYEPEVEPTPPAADGDQALEASSAPTTAPEAAAPPPPAPPAAARAPEAEAAQAAELSGEEGPGRHSPPIEAPRKNVGLKKGAKGRAGALKEFQAQAKERKVDADRTARERHRLGQLERGRLDGMGERAAPRKGSSRALGQPIKRSALSSARDGE